MRPDTKFTRSEALQNSLVGSYCVSRGLCWSSAGEAHHSGTEVIVTEKDSPTVQEVEAWYKQVRLLPSSGSIFMLRDRGREIALASSFVPEETSS